MDKIRTLIVDDEPIAREGLGLLLSADPEIDVIGACYDGRKAADTILRECPDLIFLDVQMPEVGGFQVLEIVGPMQMAVVFVTAYDEHALKAFDVHATNYLLKPFTDERFKQALQRAKKEIKRDLERNLQHNLFSLLEQCSSHYRQPVSPCYHDRIAIKEEARVFFVKVDEIDWIEANDYYVCLHVGSKSYLLRETMSELESRLDSAKFVRIHRSTIVNLDRIKEMRPWFHGEYVVILHDGRQLRLSRGRRNKLRELRGWRL